MRPFVPLLRNAHFQTIAGAYWPRPNGLGRFPVTGPLYSTEPGVQVLVHEQSPPTPPRGALLLVHGLEGSSDGGYIRSTAYAALRAGFATHRMNIRGCGGTESLCDTLYHAGLTTDIRFVAARLRERYGAPVFLAGFSLGANMCLKLAGELGADGGNLFAGVAAVSAPLDLHACAIALRHPRCRLYQDRFVRNMADRMRRRDALMPGRFPIDELPHIQTVYDFDDQITAPFFGFGDAPGYYGTQSAKLFLDDIRVPTLVIHAKDDPMIPFECYDQPAFRRNPNLTLVANDHGGHVGFLARGGRRFWLDEAIVGWMDAQAGRIGA